MAINLIYIKLKGWSVSCSYDVKLADDTGGTENNIPYDIEFLDGVFTHLAIVDNPRYERANIVFNSKTVINTYHPNQKRDEKGRWTKDDTAIQKKKDSLTPVEVNPEEVPKFKTKEELGEWFSGIFKELGNVTIEDTGIRIDLYGGNAEREAFKRRLQQEPNKAVAKAFEDVVTKSVKVDERQKDERHKHNQEIYYNKLKLGDNFYDVNLFVDYLEPNQEYRYAGHSTAKIDNKISTRDTQVINHIMLTKVDNNIITDIRENFNPDINEYEVINDKWITIHPNGEDNKGRPLLLKDGETPKEAIDRVYGPKKDKKSEPVQQYSFESKKIVVPYREYKNNWEDSGKYYTRGNYNPQDKTIELFRPWFAEEFEETFDNISKKVKEMEQEFEKNKDEAIKSNKWEEFGEATRKEAEEYKKTQKPALKAITKKIILDSLYSLKWNTGDRISYSFLSDSLKRGVNGIQYYIRRVKGRVAKDYVKSAIYELLDSDEMKEFYKKNQTIGLKTDEELKKFKRLYNDKEQDMALLEELKKLITKVENDKGEDMNDKEKIENEKADKRDIIRRIMAVFQSSAHLNPGTSKNANFII